MTTNTMLRLLHELQIEARTVADIEAQARAVVEDAAVLTERTAGNKRHKTLRIETVHLPLVPVTRPADGQKLYVVEEA